MSSGVVVTGLEEDGVLLSVMERLVTGNEARYERSVSTAGKLIFGSIVQAVFFW